MTTKELVEFYISLKRIFYDKPIQMPKQDTIDWDNLDRLNTLLTERGIPCDDYLLVNIRTYRRKNVFPKTEQLLGIKALNRYMTYAKKEYSFGKSFKTDKYSALIYKTNIYYPLKDFTTPFESDLRVMLLWTYVKEKKTTFSEDKVKKLYEVFHYTLAKYEFFTQTPPNSLLEWGKVVFGEMNECTP